MQTFKKQILFGNKPLTDDGHAMLKFPYSPV